MRHDRWLVIVVRGRFRAMTHACVAVLSMGAIAVAVWGGGSFVTASAAAAPATACPQFHVRYSQRVGRLLVPAGYYRLTPGGMTCEATLERFTAFLAVWGDTLPGGWKLQARGDGRGTFSNGSASFLADRVGSIASGAVGGSTPGVECAVPLKVSQRDYIGGLVVSPGDYRVVRLSDYSPGCSAVTSLYGSFEQDFAGPLPDGWVVLPAEGAFVKNSLYAGFRLTPWVNTPPVTVVTPRLDTVRCPNTFRVRHNDRIGPLTFPAGSYYLDLLKSSHGLSCARAADLFRTFLSRPDGRLPAPWVIHAATGTFRQGAGSPTGFAAKPAFAAQ